MSGENDCGRRAIEITLGEGNVQIGKDMTDTDTVTDEGDINMTTGNGMITISGKTKSTLGSVNVNLCRRGLKRNS